MDLSVDSLAAIITSSAGAVAVVASVMRSNSKVHRHLQRLDARVLTLGRDVKRLVVHDDKCTIEERINAGKEYVDMGGNGSTEIYLNTLKDRYQEACEGKE